MYVIAVYDVDQKRCGKMLKLCRGYLHHVQNSVFEGEITEARLMELKIKAGKIMLTNVLAVIMLVVFQYWKR